LGHALSYKAPSSRGWPCGRAPLLSLQTAGRATCQRIESKQVPW